MKSFVVAALAGVILLGGVHRAQAGVYTDDMSRCLVKAASDDDKSALIRWIFAAMASNPSVKPYANVSAAQRVQIEKSAAVLLERLLTADCRKETVDALKFEGMLALQSSFGVLGEVAMRGLMADEGVKTAMTSWTTYVDKSKIEALLKDGGMPVTPASK